MPLSSIILSRSVGSYSRIQGLVGRLIRSGSFQLRRPRVRQLTYLDIGCGPNLHTEFINLDYFWRPGVDVCWDVTRGLPFADASMRGIFSEHCLEHFPLPEVIKLLRETRRLLMRGGGIRLVVPDGEQYLITYASHRCSETPRRFPYEDKERLHELWTPMLSVNRVFYQDRESAAGHCTMFDFELLAKLLRHCGFTQIERQQFGTGRDPRLLIDSPGRSVESLYVEARID